MGGADELFELLIRYFGFVHPKAVYIHAMNRSRVGHRIVSVAHYLTCILATHRKFAARNPDHTGRREATRRVLIYDSWRKRRRVCRARPRRVLPIHPASDNYDGDQQISL